MKFSIFALKDAARFGTAAVLLVAASCFTGCASNEFSYSTTVSGGEQVKFTIVKGRTQPVKEDGVQILDAGLQPDPELKKVLYGFQFSDAKPNRVWKNVRVEDVSDPEPILLLDDADPKLVKQQWIAKTRKFDADDPALKWIFYISDSVRVYRFTLTAADGQKLVLHQPSMVPGWLKAAIRHMLGEKY